MKKLTLIALLAMMLIGMLAFAACNAKDAEEPTDETVMTHQDSLDQGLTQMTKADSITAGLIDEAGNALQKAGEAVQEAGKAVEEAGKK
ncbi:MAG: hypothetical protein LHW45_02985 [Candidatus Cloacimonetes bacterium]|nr:hypothetical protein [Candidatus Cloacimonadota bacterium]MDY0366579.1 hypothetical protein [Candidatus Syntrophosphaera sp.]